VTTSERVDQSEVGLVAEAARLRPLIDADAVAGEAGGQLTESVVGALTESGLMAIWVPGELGGSELWPVQSLKVIEALSGADGSTGWVQMAANLSTGTGAAYLASEVASELFDGQLSLIAGHGAPLGRAVCEPGGFRLTGEWSYASGLLHADYVHTGGIVFDGSKPRIDPLTGLPEFRVFVVPVDDATVKGNWDVLGLRATGSVDYSITNIFVPEGSTHLQGTRLAITGGDLYKLGILGFAAIGHTGFALGLGRRLLDEIAALARHEGDRPFVLAEQGGSESFQEQYGHLEASLLGARALTFQAWSDMEEAISAPGPIPTRPFTLVRLALNHVTSVANDIAQFAFEYGGGGAARSGTLQRCVRDMMTGAQHATTSPQILRECAKDLLGLADGKVWSMRALIDPT
jgi:indole-3-acetate monooxygenase